MLFAVNIFQPSLSQSSNKRFQFWGKISIFHQNDEILRFAREFFRRVELSQPCNRHRRICIANFSSHSICIYFGFSAEQCHDSDWELNAHNGVCFGIIFICFKIVILNLIPVIESTVRRCQRLHGEARRKIKSTQPRQTFLLHVYLISLHDLMTSRGKSKQKHFNFRASFESRIFELRLGVNSNPYQQKLLFIEFEKSILVFIKYSKVEI